MPAARDHSGRPLPPPPTWLTGIEDWVRRWAVPCGTVQARLVVEYQHGQPVLIRLRVLETEDVIRIGAP